MKEKKDKKTNKVGNVVKFAVVTVLICGMLVSTFAGLFYAVQNI